MREKLGHFSLKHTPSSCDQRGWFDPYRPLGRPTLLENMPLGRRGWDVTVMASKQRFEAIGSLVRVKNCRHLHLHAWMCLPNKTQWSHCGLPENGYSKRSSVYLPIIVWCCVRCAGHLSLRIRCSWAVQRIYILLHHARTESSLFFSIFL